MKVPVICAAAAVLMAAETVRSIQLEAPAHAAISADLHPGVSLRIRQVLVQEGGVVAVGDTLALLDDRELRLSERAAALACRRSRQRLARSRLAQSRGLISVQQLESLEWESEADRVRWERARLDLDRTAVRAPFAGVVARCVARQGDLTSPRAVLFQIIVPGDLVAELYVPADHLDLVRLGQTVSATSTLNPEATLGGRIVKISPVIDPRSGTCKVQVLFPGAGRRVRPGTLVRVLLGGEPVVHSRPHPALQAAQ